MEMLILSGGFGTRLGDTISDLPKSLAPINGVPLLRLQLHHWIKQGQKEFLFLLHHRSELIIDFLIKESSYFGSSCKIEWIVEDAPLGTGGAITNAIINRNIEGNILIANADTWLDEGLKKIINSNSPTIAAIKVNNTERYGSISINAKRLVTEFCEKKIGVSHLNKGLINAGLYKLPTSIFLGQDSNSFSLEKQILPKLLKKNILYAEIIEGYFFDIGVPKDYYNFCEWNESQIKDNE